MDSIFNLEETERSSRLRQIMETFGFTYVCLWSHFPNPSKYISHANSIVFVFVHTHIHTQNTNVGMDVCSMYVCLYVVSISLF